MTESHVILMLDDGSLWCEWHLAKVEGIIDSARTQQTESYCMYL